MQAGSPSDGFLNFDSLDRRLAKMAAAGFVGLIAVVVWAWLSWSPHVNPARVLGVHGFSGETVGVAQLDKSACKPGWSMARCAALWR